MTQGPCSIAQFQKWLHGMASKPHLEVEYEQFKAVAVWKVRSQAVSFFRVTVMLVAAAAWLTCVRLRCAGWDEHEVAAVEAACGCVAESFGRAKDSLWS